MNQLDVSTVLHAEAAPARRRRFNSAKLSKYLVKKNFKHLRDLAHKRRQK